MTFFDKLVESKYIPLTVYRLAIRFLLSRQLRNRRKNFMQKGESYTDMVRFLSEGPIAVATNEANTQHYEVKPDFYKKVLGKHLKYSSAYWDDTVNHLSDAENKMLYLTSQRAQIKDGQTILDLGCGWGSLTLYLAKQFPNAKIVSVSNSQGQIDYITREAERLGYDGVQAKKADINELDFDIKFDRIVSVEMFEHLSNYKELFSRIASWLNDDGYLMTHIFGHKKFCYKYSVEGQSSWIARHFFTGGIMPAEKIFSYFQDQLMLVKQWRVSGLHYHKTCEFWLKNHYMERNDIIDMFDDVYGKGQGAQKWRAWKMFFLACSELFKYKKGTEWMVFHNLFKKKDLVNQGL